MSIKTKIVSYLAVAVMTVTAVSVPVSAQISTGASNAKGTGVASSLSPGSFATRLVNWILWFVGILAVVMLIWGGIRYMTSGGDSNKLTAAKNTILYAVIGLIVVIFAYAIVNFINLQFGNPSRR